MGASDAAEFVNLNLYFVKKLLGLTELMKK